MTSTTLYPADKRGHFQNEWLDSHHSFSFGEFYDPTRMGVSLLRVMNEDRVIPGAGFPTHPHRDMEIITYVLEGALEHKDSMGNGSVIRAHDVQRMSAGRGVTHSEFNPSDTEGGHFLQIWIKPRTRGIAPSYAEKHFSTAAKTNQLCCIISPGGREGSIQAHADALVFASVLDAGKRIDVPLANDRMAYIHVVHGQVDAAGHALQTGDGLEVSDTRFTLAAQDASECLVFDLPRAT